MRKLLSATLLSVALAVGVAASPAHAFKSTTVADDPNDAYRGIDMHKVKIQKLRSSIEVRTLFSHLGRNLNGVQYYFDTNKHRPGPEYGAVFYKAKDGDRLAGTHVYRMRGWNKPPGNELNCATMSTWKINRNGTGVFTARFGFGCLEGKERFRAAARTWDYTKYKVMRGERVPTFGHTDAMGSKRSFSRWIR